MRKLLVSLTILCISLGMLLLSACGATITNLKLSFIVDNEVYQVVETTGSESVTIPENPVKEGYTFEGWFWDDGVWEKPFTANSLLDAPITSDMRVYARFIEVHTHNYTTTVVEPTYTEQGYTLYTCSCGDSYKDNFVDKLVGGITFNTLTQKPDNTYFIKLANGTESFSFENEIQTKEGVTYTVCTDSEGQNAVASNTVSLVTGDNLYYISVLRGDEQTPTVYTVNIRVKPKYTVSFNTLEGSSVERQEIEEDACANQPLISPYKEGYNFKGWDFDFTTPITGATTITVKPWQAKTLTITFDANGGGLDGGNNEVVKELVYNESYGQTPSGTRYGYGLVGWATKADGTGIVDTAKVMSFTQNTTLYAVWQTDFEYVYYSNTDSYSASSVKSSGDAVILDTYNDKKVTSIGSVNKNITSLTIGKNIKEIGVGLLSSSNLERVTITGSTKISDRAFMYCHKINSVNLGGATQIGEQAFYDCWALKSVVIPNSVTTIGRYAFGGCKELTSLTIGGSVTSIAEKAFENCKKLAEIKYNAANISDLSKGIGLFNCAGQEGEGIALTIGASVQRLPKDLFNSGSESSNPKLLSLAFEDNSVCETIGQAAFANTSSLVSVYIPSSVKTIGYSFYNCAALQTVTFGNNSQLQSLAGNAFERCPALSGTEYSGAIYLGSVNNPYMILLKGSADASSTSCNIHADAKFICNGAFSGKGVTSVTVPKSILGLGSSIFSGCTELQTVTFESGSQLQTIGSSAFSGCAKLTGIDIPSGVTSIGNSAFSGCSLLERVTIEDDCKLTDIGREAFNECAKLASVNLPKGVISIGMNAFNGCASLETLTFASDGLLETIGEAAFKDCKIKGFTLPGTVTTIGKNAFYNCTEITTLTIPGKVASIGKNAFYNAVSLTEIIFNATECADFEQVGTDYNGVFYNGGANGTGISITIGANVKKIPAFAFHPGGSSSLNATSLTFEANSVCTSIGNQAFMYLKNITELVIPANVETLCEYAFYGCELLESVTFAASNKLKTIGANAFCGCNFQTIDIPTSVTTMGEGAFSYCARLTGITIPSGVTTIGDSAFSGCAELTGIVIPSNVTAIGEYAFNKCVKLTNITIPSKVTRIGRYAFNECTALASITFADTTTWYCTIDDSYTGGTVTDVTTPSTNATNLVSSYAIYTRYLYKV